MVLFSSVGSWFHARGAAVKMEKWKNIVAYLILVIVIVDQNV